MLLWPIRWLIQKTLELALVLVLAMGGLLLAFRWLPLVPVAVVTSFLAGEAPRWRWLSQAEIPPALYHGFRIGLESPTACARLSTRAQAAVALLYPPRQGTKGAELWGAILEALWGRERLLHLYLAGAPWGDRIWGAWGASQAYFAKPPTSLSLEEIAELLLLRRFPHLGQSPDKPKWFLEQKRVLIRRIQHAIEKEKPTRPSQQEAIT